MIERFFGWWRWQMLTPEEKYLMQSTDIYDLERRMNKIYGKRG